MLQHFNKDQGELWEATCQPCPADQIQSFTIVTRPVVSAAVEQPKGIFCFDKLFYIYELSLSQQSLATRTKTVNSTECSYKNTTINSAYLNKVKP